MKISRRAYAALYGPTAGDRVRLGDTDLVLMVEQDLTQYGEEVVFGGGKVIRDGQGQSQRSRASGAPDLVITNAIVLDASAIVKADVGIRDGRISAIGKAGNPDVQDGVTPGLEIGPSTEIVAGEGKILTAGGIDSHIHTYEDAEFLMRSGALPLDRIRGVQTGGCPHTAIREDTSINQEAVDEMLARFPDLDLVFLESGGDNLAASFSPELVDVSIYVVDVAGGDKVPRKGGPGVTRSDLLVINKIDLAPYVGADLDVMARDAVRQRAGKPVIFTNLKTGDGVAEVIRWIRHDVLFEVPA